MHVSVTSDDGHYTVADITVIVSESICGDHRRDVRTFFFEFHQQAEVRQRCSNL